MLGKVEKGLSGEPKLEQSFECYQTGERVGNPGKPNGKRDLEPKGRSGMVLQEAAGAPDAEETGLPCTH